MFARAPWCMDHCFLCHNGRRSSLEQSARTETFPCSDRAWRVCERLSGQSVRGCVSVLYVHVHKMIATGREVVGLQVPKEREGRIRGTHQHPFTYLHAHAHLTCHPPAPTAHPPTPRLPPPPRTHRSLMQQAVRMVMTDRARAATSRPLSCTLQSRHGENKTEGNPE